MKIKTDADQLLFSAAYILCMVDSMIFGYSMFGFLKYSSQISTVICFTALLLVLTKLIMDRSYPHPLLIGLITIGLMLLVIYLRSGYNHILYIMVLLLGLRRVDTEKLIKLDYWCKLFLFCLVLLCCITSIIDNYTTYRTGETTLRYALGFNHPNTLACLVMSLVLEDAYLRDRSGSFVYSIVIWTLTFVTYWITRNRTAVFILGIFPTLLYLNRISICGAGREKVKLWVFGFPILAIFSFLAMRGVMENGFLKIIDSFFSNRFYNAGVIFNHYGVPLLGQKVALVSVREARLSHSSIALLDVAYLRMLIQAGPILLIMLALLYTKACHSSCKDEWNQRSLFLKIFFLFGLFESGFNNVFINFTLLFATKAFYELLGDEVPEEICSESSNGGDLVGE